MNIHHLELFYYVAKHGGIAAAVRKIPYGIQQPAISGQIARLEESLGVKLFTRRPFSLSSAGEGLFEFIEPFFANLDSVAARVRGNASPQLRIAAPSVALHEYVPNLLQRVRERFPTFKLKLHEAGQPDAERLLLSQEIDLALAVLEKKPRAGLESCVLLEIPLALVLPKNHALTDSNELWRCDTIEETLISLAPGETVSACFQRGLESLGVEWRTGVEVNSTRLIECYVANGFGIGVTAALPGILPDPAVRHLLLDGFPRVTVGALWAGELAGPAADFLQEVQKQAAQI